MTSHKSKQIPHETIRGHVQHLIYSPRGEIEGALMEVDAAPLQLVFSHEDVESGAQFAAIASGQLVSVTAHPQGPSPKGAGDHPVYAHIALLTVDGHRPAKPDASAGAAYQGRVIRLNHARHGEANGVVLDTGDFIHLKPDGMARLGLKVGDAVQADGDAHRLADDSGWAVEASHVNGKPVKRH